MKLSDIKALKAFCIGLDSEPDYREVLEHTGEEDFWVSDVRFIREDSIDAIQQDELANDLYMLGCFNANFISSIIEIDADVVESMQEAEAFEAIGKLIISLGKLEDMQQEYCSLDGYGHHFNGYDGSEEEITINGINYLVFDNH